MKQRPRLLLDENIGLRVYNEIRNCGYQVQSVLIEKRGAPDTEVIREAIQQDKIIVTMDKDFGYLAQAYKPPGIIILRLRDPGIPNRIRAILRALQLKEKLHGYITIVADARIRRRPITV